MRKLVTCGLIGAAAGLTALASPASATHAWGNYHWARTTSSFTLALGDNVSVAWDSHLATSSAQWSVSTVLDTTVTAGSSSPKQCRAKAGRVEVCSASYGRNGWLGLASISLREEHITAGTVKLNDTYFAMAQYNTPEDRAHVMCQEIGHTLGLGHTSEDGSSQQTCMDYSSDAASTAPNDHDYAQLASIYFHRDPTSTVGAGTTSGSPQVGNDRSSWGREVHRSADGRHSTFVRSFGKDASVVTQVTWAR